MEEDKDCNEKRKQGRPRKNKIDTPSTGRRKWARPRKEKVMDAIVLGDQLESSKHGSGAFMTSGEKRKRGRPRKKKDDILSHLSKSCIFAQDMHSERCINYTQHTIVEADTQLKVEKEDKKDKRERKEKIRKTHKEHQSLIKVCHTDRRIKEEEMKPTIKELIDIKLKVKEEEEDNGKRKKIKCRKSKEQHSRGIWLPTEKERARVQEKADSFVSNFPCYKCCPKQFNVQELFILVLLLGNPWFRPMHLSEVNISNPFSRDYFPPFTKKIVLQNSKGKGWIVMVIPISGWHLLSGGWHSFVLHNRPKEGDVCMFELVKRSEMQVHVFQASKFSKSG